MGATVCGAVHPGFESDSQPGMVSGAVKVLMPQVVEDGTVKLLQVVEHETSNVVDSQQAGDGVQTCLISFSLTTYSGELSGGE
jgi:hypothetical protein